MSDDDRQADAARREWVRATRAAQGLPMHCTDPVALEQTARIIVATRRERAAAEAEQ